MTEGYQPPTSRGANADQDTTTLPRVVTPPNSQPPRHSGGGAGWSQASRHDSRGAEETSGNQRGRLSNAASAAANATAGTRTALRSAADEAESRATRPAARGGTRRQPRRARLTLSHVNVYSVFKFSCVLAIALFFVWLIMVGVLYGVLDVSGVFDKVNKTVHQISGDGKSTDIVTGPLVFGFAIIIGVVNIVLFIALSTIGAMVYNLCADLVGGTEVTLSERE